MAVGGASAAVLERLASATQQATATSGHGWRPEGQRARPPGRLHPRRSAGRRGPLLQGSSRPPSTSPCRLAPGARVPGTYVVEGSRRIADRGVGDLPATPVLRRCQRPRGQFDPASSRRRGPILRPRKPLDLGPHPERSHADSDISRRPVRLLQILGSGSIAGHLTQENSRSQTDGGRGQWRRPPCPLLILLLPPRQ